MRLAVLVLFLFVACTSGASEEVTTTDEGAATTTTSQPTTTTTSPVTTTTEATATDFSQIAGDWTGTAEEGAGFRFRVELTVNPVADKLSEVATVEYFFPREAEEPSCGGSWTPLSADPPVYVLRETVTFGDCSNGTVRLEYLPASDEVVYRFAADSGPLGDAEGVLGRASS